jgi:acyl phosphate:glycerol-3-phosphate acyltransferase
VLIVILTLLAYLIGSIPFAVITSRALGLPDPRSYGSGNPGATNVLRTGKKAAAALTLLGDAAKGTLAVVIAAMAVASDVRDVAMASAAVAAVLGHMFPLFLRLHGGKGVATALGVVLALNVYVAAGTLATWLIMVIFFRISSLAALVSALFAPFFTALLFSIAHPYFIAITVISALLIWRHVPNIRKILDGTEARIGGTRGV